MIATQSTIVTLATILTTTAALHGDGSSANPPEAFYLAASNSNAPLRRNGNGAQGVGFDVPWLGSYTQPGGIGIDPVNKKAYYSRVSSIYSNGLDGSNPVLVRNFGTTQFTPVKHVEVDDLNEHIYLTINAGDYPRGIYRMNYDGSGVTAIITEALLDTRLGINHDPRLTAKTNDGLYLDVPNGRLFWGDGDDVFTCTLAGEGAAYLFSFPFNYVGSYDIDGANGKVYYSNGSTEIFRCNLDGSGIESLFAPGYGYPEGLAYHAPTERLYFVHARNMKFLDTNTPSTTGDLGPWGWERAIDMEIGPMADLTTPVLTVRKEPSGGTVKLRTTFNTDPGIEYTIYQSTDLETWTSTGVKHVGDGTPAFSHFPFNTDQKFFRVQRESPLP